MTYLTTAEVAEIKGCTPQYARKLCQNGKIEHIAAESAANNRLEYRVPLSALSEKEQLRYENRERGELGLSPIQPSKPEKQPDKRQITLQDLDGGQRQDAAQWCKIIQDWLAVREAKSDELGGKVKVDEMYCAAVKLQYPDLSISTDILYRKYKAWVLQLTQLRTWR